MNWRERITVDPNVCHGQACVKGTRIMAAVVLDNLAAGVPTDELLRSYPTLSADDIQAALEYAAELARERTVLLSVGAALGENDRVSLALGREQQRAHRG